MIIAIDTRFLVVDYPESYGYFLYETFRRLTKNHPEHQFIFIFDKAYDPGFVFEENVTRVISGPVATNPILWKYWYDVKVPGILKKYNADVFVTGNGFCSLYTKVPQCMIVQDFSFLHFPQSIKKTHLLFYKKYTTKFIAKTTSIAVFSGFIQQEIVERYKKKEQDIAIIYKGINKIFKPVSEKEKVAVKTQYTAGKEYMVYAGAIHSRKNLINLLKAFSVFKKRQQTNMKLVLVGKLAWNYESFLKKLNTYKYSKEVIMAGLQKESELVKIIGAAYAMVFPSFYEGFGVQVLEAMKCDVPVITSSATAMQEIAKDAALYANPNDHKEIAEQMMLLYKDEQLRTSLIEKGRVVSKEYNWDITSALLWKSILKATS